MKSRYKPIAAHLLLVALVASGARPTAAVAQDVGDPSKGQAYAERHCAGCHGVGPADRTSPKLGLATFRMIAGTPGMTGTALAAWLRTPHNAMPNLIVEADDRLDLIAYILSLREPRPSK